jgi:hypothetical protein
VCPEYQDLRCASQVECSMEKERGCRVCECKPVNAETFPGSAVYPDQRQTK